MHSNARFNHYDNLCLDWYRYVFANQRRSKDMDKKKILEKAAVMLAFVEGKKIEVRNISSSIWRDDDTPFWDWWHNDYRIKPEPPRKFVRYYVIDQRNPDSLGTAFLNKESAQKNCIIWNIYTQKEVYSVVAFELTEIKENAA